MVQNQINNSILFMTNNNIVYKISILEKLF